MKSSDGDSTYVVQFIFDAGKLSVYCACIAGALGKICKHKISLLNGDGGSLVDSGQDGRVAEVQKWIMQSDWPALLRLFGEAEVRASAAQTELARMKKKMEAGMKNGL